MKNYETIRATAAEGWVEIFLNRPETLNSFSSQMQSEIVDAIEAGVADADCRAILISGEGTGFCSGQDLRQRDPRKMDGPPDLSKTVSTVYNPLVELIRSAPIPIVCAVNGVAAGAGVGIALSCDIVIAAQSAKFVFAFSRIGLIPDAGSSWLLSHYVGQPRARAIAMLGSAVDADQAAEWGMIWRSVEDAELLDEARKTVQKLARGSASALTATKAVFTSAPTNSFTEQLAVEAEMQGECGRTPDYAEGVLAFLEKRRPNFQPREGKTT